ncbi:MAG: AI-2E family transporter [Planctomycetales bacterium]
MASSTASARPLVTFAAFIVVVAGMKAATAIVVPFLLASFIAIICAPALYWLKSKRVPTPIALFIVIAVMGLIAGGLLLLVGSSLTSFVNNLDNYKADLKKTTDGFMNWLERHEVLNWIEKVTGTEISVQAIGNYLDTGKLLDFAGSMVNGLAGVLTNSILIVLTVIFILLEAAGFPAKLRALSGGSDEAKQQFDRIVTDVRRYVTLKSWMCVSTGLSVTIFLYLMNVDYPLLWGTLAFLFNYIPNIGSFIAAIPAVLLALVQLGFGGAVWTAAGYTVINMIIGNVIEPRIFGRGLGLSTLVVFVSLVLWGWVLGPVGMLLSAPLTMVVKIVLENRPDTRWIAILLSSDAIVDQHQDGQDSGKPSRDSGGEIKTDTTVT